MMNCLEQNSSFEGMLVKYYDMFFLGGGVEQECSYIHSLIKKYSQDEVSTLADIGCGTGYHSWFFTNYYEKIMGMDISEDMILYAKSNRNKEKLEFICSDIRNYQGNEQFDSAVALSHVIGYQLNNESVEKMLVNIASLLTKNKIFLFNFYHEPALYLNGLKSMMKKVQSEHTKITRFSNASINSMENVLELEYHYIIENEDENLKQVNIKEKMRYFTKKELEYYLNNAGFKVLDCLGHRTNSTLSERDWNGIIIAKKR